MGHFILQNYKQLWCFNIHKLFNIFFPFVSINTRSLVNYIKGKCFLNTNRCTFILFLNIFFEKMFVSLYFHQVLVFKIHLNFQLSKNKFTMKKYLNCSSKDYSTVLNERLRKICSLFLCKQFYNVLTKFG